MSTYIKKEQEQAIADLDKTILRLTETRQRLFDELNKTLSISQQLLDLKTKAKGTWVILKNDGNGVYYQFDGFGLTTTKGVRLLRNATISHVPTGTFNANFKIATPSEVNQHLAYLSTKNIKVGLISIKGEKQTNLIDPTKCEFYMVTCRGIRGAKKRHTTYEAAETEAIAIAKSENHETWIVGVVASIKPVTKTVVETSYQVKKA